MSLDSAIYYAPLVSLASFDNKLIILLIISYSSPLYCRVFKSFSRDLIIPFYTNNYWALGSTEVLIIIPNSLLILSSHINCLEFRSFSKFRWTSSKIPSMLPATVTLINGSTHKFPMNPKIACLSKTFSAAISFCSSSTRFVLYKIYLTVEKNC